MTPVKAPDTIAVQKAYAARVDTLLADKIEPRAIDPLGLGQAAEPVATATLPHLADFADFHIDAAVLEFLKTTGKQLVIQVSALPADLRKALRVPQTAKDLANDSVSLLVRWSNFLDRAARSKAERKAAKKLGYGHRRGKSIRTLEANYRTILAATKDAEACALLTVVPAQIAALQTMYDRLLAALPLVKAQGLSRKGQIKAINRARLTLELVYQDIGKAAEWCLEGDARVALLSLLPRSEVGRSKPAAAVVAPVA